MIFKGHFLGFYSEFEKKTSQKVRGRKKKTGEKGKGAAAARNFLSTQCSVQTHIPVLSEMQQDERKPGRNEDTAKGTLPEPDPHATIKSREIYLHPNDVSILQVIRC